MLSAPEASDHGKCSKWGTPRKFSRQSSCVLLKHDLKVVYLLSDKTGLHWKQLWERELSVFILQFGHDLELPYTCNSSNIPIFWLVNVEFDIIFQRGEEIHLIFSWANKVTTTIIKF